VSQKLDLDDQRGSGKSLQLSEKFGGEGGIRTPGPSRVNGFQDPSGHPIKTRGYLDFLLNLSKLRLPGSYRIIPESTVYYRFNCRKFVASDGPRPRADRPISQRDSAALDVPPRPRAQHLWRESRGRSRGLRGRVAYRWGSRVSASPTRSRMRSVASYTIALASNPACSSPSVYTIIRSAKPLMLSTAPDQVQRYPQRSNRPPERILDGTSPP